MSKYYVIYDMEDNYIKECKNHVELAEFFGKKRESIACSTSRFLQGKISSIISSKDNKHYKVYKYEEKNQQLREVIKELKKW